MGCVMEKENSQTVLLRCKHCSNEFKCALPKTEGAFKVLCPNCKKETIVKFVPKEVKLGGGEKEESGKVVVCPDCEKKFRFDFQSDGKKSVNCPHCNAPLEIQVKEGCVVRMEKKKTKPLDIQGMSGKGKLSIVRFHGLLGGWGKKSYPLHVGSNTIGRYDEDLRCDIEIKNDDYMSRRSVVIEVIQKEKGFLFKFTVLKAANPVMHNNKPLVVGESIYLNYGDSIRLGNTTFNFEKA